MTLVPPPAPVAATAARTAPSPPESASGPDQTPPVGVPGADPLPRTSEAEVAGCVSAGGHWVAAVNTSASGSPPTPDAPGASGASPARPTTGGRGAGRPAAAGGASPRRPATHQSEGP
jgi:hypothetical protein